MLNGANTVAQIGNQATVGTISTTGSLVAGLTGGTIDMTNYGDLAVIAPVIATPGSVAIAVHAGSGTLGTLTTKSTIQADTTVSLTADQDIYNYGSVIAGTDATLDAVGDIENETSIHADNDVTLTAGHDIYNNYLIDAGRDVHLSATNDIDNYGSITAARDGTLDAAGYLYNEEGEGGGGLIQVGNNATLHATNDIDNYGGSVIAGIDATLSAGNDFYSYGLIQAGNDVTLTAGHDIYNDYLIDAGRDVHLGATNDIDNYASIIAGRDVTLVAGNDIDNYMQELGLSEADYVDAGSLITGGHDAILQATHDIDNEADIVAGRNATLTAGQTVAVSGTVQAGDGGTLTAIGQVLTLAADGSLIVHPIEPQGGGTIVPGLIQLQADAMALAGGHVVADDGAVAIAPLTAGSTLSFDAATAAGHLSLTQANLDAIETIGSLGAGNGPLGTQTLVLGSLDGANASTTTGRLAINAGMVLGAIASTLSVFSAGDVVEQNAGAVSVSALTGAAPNGHIVLNGVNAVAQIGNQATVGTVTTTGSFVAGLSGRTIDVSDDRDLTVIAPVIATLGAGEIAVHAGAGTLGTLRNASTIQAASTVGLSADQDIHNAGGVIAGTDASLSAGHDLNNYNFIHGGNDVALTAGNALHNYHWVDAGRDTHLGATNDIANDGSVSAGGDASLSASRDVANDGALDAGNDAALTAGRDLTSDGAVHGGNDATLSAGNDIANGGSVGAGRNAKLGADGDIATAGMVTAGTGADLNAAGAIDDSGTIMAGGNVTLTAGTNITQSTGAILAGTVVTDFATSVGSPTDTFGVLVGGSDLVSLAAGAGTIAVNGDLAANHVILSAAGDINDTGTITADLLTGSAGIAPTVELPNGTLGSANLTGTNRIATLGEFLTTGSLTLNDGQALMIADPVTTGAIAAGNPQVGGRTFGATINVAGDLITVAGSLTAGVAAPGAPAGLVLAGGDIALSAGGTILIPGAAEAAGGANGGGTLTTRAGSAINETGAVSAVVLTGSAGGAANFAGADATANEIQRLGAFTAGDLALTTGRDLLASGPAMVDAGPEALTIHAGHGTAGMLTNDATIAATGSVSLMTDADMHVGGAVTAGQAVNLRSGGAIATSGNIGAGSDVTLDAGTDLIQTAGIVSAGGNVILGAGRDIAQAGGTIAAAGDASLTAGQAALGGIALAGVVKGGGVRLSASRDIVETGTIASTLLTGNAGLAPSAALPDGILGSATLTGVGNRIATLGSFLTTGNLTLIDGQALTIAGPVTTGAIAAGNTEVAGRTFGATIAAPEITVAGELTAGLPAPGGSAGTPGGDVVLTASGPIELAGLIAAQAGSNGGGGFVVNSGAGLHQSGGGVLAGTLSGTAGGSVSLDVGSNRIASIGDFTVNPPTTGSFRLTDIGNVQLAGTLTSHLIVIDDRAGQIIFDDGTEIVTGGRAQPSGAFQAPVEADGGAFLTDFVQFGRSTVSGMNGNPATLVINALGQGSIVFDRRSLTSGLYGPNTWLVLTLGDPGGMTGLGQARGNVFVHWLDVEFHGTGGSADLGGTIGTLSGAVAAGSAGISPRADSNYRFNSCPIHSVHCVVLAVEGLPPRSPLQDLSIDVLSDSDSDDDLLLPIVSDRDYTLTDGKTDQDLLLPIISHRDY